MVFKMSVILSVLSHKLESNRRVFMKIILSIYDQSDDACEVS